MSAGAQTGSAPMVTVHRDPVPLLALVGGGVLLVEAVPAALLFGFGDPSSSPQRTVLLLAVGALLACGAALLVRSAPLSAALLCLLAAGLAAAAQLPFFVERLHWYYMVSFSHPYEVKLIKRTDDGYVFTALVGGKVNGWHPLEQHRRTLSGEWGGERWVFTYQPWGGHLVWTYWEHGKLVVPGMTLKKVTSSTSVPAQTN